MSELAALRVTVAGAGVFGLAAAITLARRGARVTVFDPDPEGANASAVAAGMVAPAFEAALDAASRGAFPLLRRARDLWPAFAQGLDDIGLRQDGAVFRGSDAEQARVFESLQAEGAEAYAAHGGVFTPEDWRLEPRLALKAMRAESARLGVVIVPKALTSPEGEATVLACGCGGKALAPELGVLSPIKGQILRFAGGPQAGPVRRSPRGYLAPSPLGALVGATMQAGADDVTIDPQVSARLAAAGAELAPELERQDFRAQAGVRAATPDGLPLAGASARPGVWLAAGARRNGWLLAPLVAEVVADSLAGGAANPAFDPARFPVPAQD